MTTGDGSTDFETASKVSALLRPVSKDRQQKILRWVAEDLDVLLAGAGPSTSGAALSDVGRYSPTQQAPRTTDIKSFVAAKNPRSDMQFAAVVAYYYRFEAPPDDSLESISPEVLQNAARLVNRHRLSRPRQTLLNAKAQGYLDLVERGQYRINSVGENLVAMTLPGPEPSVAPLGRPARSRTKKVERKKAGGKTPSTKGSQGQQKKKGAPKKARQ
jgi:hypothetical protein